MTFYKYKCINNNTLDSLKDKYFYYSRQEQLDDPFDMYTPVEILKTDKEIRELFKRYPELATVNTVDSYKKKQIRAQSDEKYHAKFYETTQVFHVLSLTPICDNDAMWALYADNHKGIAIGYKTEQVNNSHYISLGQKREINRQRKFLLEQGKDSFYENPDLRIVLKPIVYDISKIRKFTPLMVDPYGMLGNIYIKKPLWSFEEEYRSVIISKEHRYKDLKIYYPDEVLSEIIFGYRTCNEDIQRITNLIKENYKNQQEIRFYKAIPNRNKMSIELQELVWR
ncbi:MAG: DUF2971 domain-containing protein [Treponema sp.]|nr:DUF2971 domain-containing protein [Treponema sp.]